MKGYHQASVRALAWSHKQYGLLFSGGGASDGILKSWNMKTKQQVDERNTGAQICSIITGKNSNDVFTSHGYPTNDIMVWRAKGLKKIARLSLHEERVLYMAMSPDGEKFISASADETLCFWKTSPQKQ